jgi:hypothetical protein
LKTLTPLSSESEIEKTVSELLKTDAAESFDLKNATVVLVLAFGFVIVHNQSVKLI